MVLLHFSKYAPWRIRFIPQWLLCEQKETTKLKEILTDDKDFPPTDEIVCWIHTTRDAVSSFVVMVVVTRFLLRDDYSIELVWQYCKMYFVYIVDHSFISIQTAANENKHLDCRWGIDTQQKQRWWRLWTSSRGPRGTWGRKWQDSRRSWLTVRISQPITRSRRRWGRHNGRWSQWSIKRQLFLPP